MKVGKNMGSKKKRGVKRARVEISPFFLGNRGGRRSGLERRRFLYTHHIPERRIVGDRRRIKDRRSQVDYSIMLRRKREEERRTAFMRFREYVEADKSEIIFTEGNDREASHRITQPNENQES